MYRKLRDDAAWGTGTALAANATNYVDSNVAVGSAYEYESVNPPRLLRGAGYIYAGIQAPLVESRGKVILLVDNTFSVSLATELARLQQDLVGDGWTVLRHDVPRMAVDPANTSSNVWAARSNELASVKALITADYNADPTNVKAVFLLGHVPVPYSGKLAPDDHSNHLGAWPADMYYGDMSGIWTDSMEQHDGERHAELECARRRKIRSASSAVAPSSCRWAAWIWRTCRPFAQGETESAAPVPEQRPQLPAQVDYGGTTRVD